MNYVEFVLLFIFGLISYYFLSQRKPKNYPPGPYGIPILGHLTLMGKEPYKTFMKWKRKYGPVISVNFGSYKTVVISDGKILREAFNDNSFAGRPTFQKYIDRFGGKEKGIVFNSGEDWTEQRRFSMKNLRDLGLGRKSMEGAIQEELAAFIDFLKAKNGESISTRNMFNASIVNALWSILSGEKVNREDSVIQNVFEAITSSFEKSNKLTGLATFIPWIGKYFPELSGFRKNVLGAYDPLINFIRNYLIKHKKTYVEGNPSNFIDLYLDEICKTKNHNSSFHKDNDGDQQLLFVIFDLFLAGAETSSTTLNWLSLIAALKPEIQKKVQNEIQSVIGNSRLPSLTDRPLMPYTEAFIHEVMRFSALTPMAVFHSTTKDTKILNFDIPKDTMIVGNIYGILHDEEAWKDPEEIRPERFLSQDGKIVLRNENLIPFSVGKRVCLGENLAKDELFLFTSGILQNFDILVDPNGPRPNLEYKASNILSPNPHKLVFKPKN